MGAAIAYFLFPGVKSERDLLDSETVLIFLGLLPLLNTLWDWVSLGVSRGLLAAIRLGRHQGLAPFLWGLADFVLAFVFMAGLVAMVTAALAGLNLLSQAGGGPLLIDLQALFDGLRSDPGNPRYYWLYFMFLSTLIPTLLHLLIAGASLMQYLAHWQPLKQWREKAAEDLADDSDARISATVYLSVVPMLGLVMPLILLWGLQWALTIHGGWLGGRVIDWAETINRVVGA
jgi:hypothetical protein